MEISKVKETLVKNVLFTLPSQDKESEFILTAYIYRIDPKNPDLRLHQLELLDKRCGNSVVIASIKDVKVKE